MSSPSNLSSTSAWSAAAQLVARWLERRERVDALLENLPLKLGAAERTRAHGLVLGVVRHHARLDAATRAWLAHPARPITQAALLLAGFELIESSGEMPDGLAAKIVHHAVEQTKHLASPAEARLVNAIVRKLATSLPAQPVPGRLADAAALAEYFSHPVWLVQRWLAQFGAEATRRLLEWNQSPAPVYARWRAGATAAGEAAVAVPDFLRPTQWAGFYEVPPGHWREVERLLAAGQVYLQDPSTRLAVELLAPQPGEMVVDLCAAPGGKSVLIADTMGAGRLVAFDLPGVRLDRLKENLARTRGVEVALVQGDVLKDAGKLLIEHNLPSNYPAVLLDAPCSNTGVMRHRVDVKWRLQAGDFARHAEQQRKMLVAAGRLVLPGGRLIYSTCSIDPEENEQVVAAFVAQTRGLFSRETEAMAWPWESAHDGAAVFRLRRAG